MGIPINDISKELSVCTEGPNSINNKHSLLPFMIAVASRTPQSIFLFYFSPPLMSGVRPKAGTLQQPLGCVGPRTPLIHLLFLSPALPPLGVSGAPAESEGEEGGAAAEVSTPCRLLMCLARFVVLPAYLIATRHCLHITCVLSSFPSLWKNPK